MKKIIITPDVRLVQHACNARAWLTSECSPRHGNLVRPEAGDRVIHRGLNHDFQSILVRLVPLQKNQEMLHTKSTYY